jgi:hypothetical protein
LRRRRGRGAGRSRRKRGGLRERGGREQEQKDCGDDRSHHAIV